MSGDRGREANVPYQATMQKARKRAAADPSLIPHGTVSGYKYWGCKCDRCTNADRLSAARQKALRRQGQGKRLTDFERELLRSPDVREPGLAERFAAYSGLRTSGLDTYDAAREVGISDRSRGRYERAFREANGLPRVPPWPGTRSADEPASFAAPVVKASNLAGPGITMTTFG